MLATCASAGSAEGPPSNRELRLDKSWCSSLGIVLAAGMGDEASLAKLDIAQLQACGTASQPAFVCGYDLEVTSRISGSNLEA